MNSSEMNESSDIQARADASSSDDDTYNPNVDYYRKGMTVDEMVDLYDKWSDTYDKDITKGIYNGPTILAEYAAKHYPPEVRGSIKIIDIAAGTGKVGAELLNQGFRWIDALDPSTKMLEIAKKQNIYKNYHVEYLGDQKSSIPNDYYDCLVVCGAMGESHLPISCLHEMIRILKPGGLTFIIIREKYLKTVEEYKDRLEPLMEELEEKKLWQKKSRLVITNYSRGKNGVLFIHKIL